jgi:hypothetical protein
MNRSAPIAPARFQPRSSAVVRDQLEELEAIAEKMLPPEPGDVAAEAQWQTLQIHRAELEEELAQARLIEGETATAKRAGRDLAKDNSLLSGLEDLIAKARRFLGSTPRQGTKESKHASSRHTKV